MRLATNLFPLFSTLTLTACVLATLSGVCGLDSLSSKSNAADKAADKTPARRLRHIVMYKFKDEMTPAQIQEVVDAFSALPKKISAIVGYEHGTNVSPENKSQGFTHCFVVTFRDEAGRDAYLVDPAHAAYVNVVKDRREKVIVFDYWTVE